jgi:hypothetical protein
VILEASGSILVACIGDHDGRVRSWLERFIIMEDVSVADVSEQLTSIVVYAGGGDGDWTLPNVPQAPLVPIPLVRHTCGLALTAVSSADDAGTVLSGLGTSVDSQRFHHDRVAAGVPWMGTEIGEQRHPLEARLRRLISFTKGCYIGQEVIARLDAYRKVQMALTRFTGSIASGERLPIALTSSDGASAGLVTSAGGTDTSVCGLGFVRVNMLKGDLTLRSPNGTAVIPLDTDASEHIYS